MTANWYALHVKPHKERFVYERLLTSDGNPFVEPTDVESRVIEVFYPAVRVKPKNPRAAKIRPYFPGYLFVRADLESVGDNAFSWIPGAHDLVRFGNIPAAVPESLVRELKQRITQIEEAGGFALDTLHPGDPVRIIDGPFAGYEAIFDAQLSGKERVQVLLSFLSSHPQRVQLDNRAVKKVKKS